MGTKKPINKSENQAERSKCNDPSSNEFQKNPSRHNQCYVTTSDEAKEDEEEAKVKTNELLEEDFVCSCCLEILLEPTTLTCGHTFCRFCLAKWWDTSRRTECVECRRPISEFPSVNFTLRNTLEKLYPERIEDRQRMIKSQPDYASVLESFESHVQLDRDSANERRNRSNFNCGTLCIILSIIIALVILIAIGMRTLFGGPDVLLDSKVITEWTPDDVAYWVGEQGTWAKGIYDDRFRSAGIDGSLLLKMTEDDLANPPINMYLGLHRRVFIDALKRIKLLKKDGPGDFWEFKAANRAKSLFLLFGLRQFPRTMILYLYLFDYQDLFIPFLHRTCGLENTHSLNSTIPLSWEQWQSFIFWTMAFPYYMIASYASCFLAVNYWISRVVMIHAFAMGCLELTNATWFLHVESYKAIPGMMLKNFILVLGCSLLLKILWPFVPFFICDMIFSWMFFISPFDALNRLFRKINAYRQQPPNNMRRNGPVNWQFDFRFQRD